MLGQDIVLALYGPKWLEGVPAILPLSLAAAVAMMFHYVPMAMTAIGRPYLSALPVAGHARRPGSPSACCCSTAAWRSFAWALCLATIGTAPVIADAAAALSWVSAPA